MIFLAMYPYDDEIVNCSLIVKAVVAFLVAAILFDVAISITNMKIRLYVKRKIIVLCLYYTP